MRWGPKDPASPSPSLCFGFILGAFVCLLCLPANLEDGPNTVSESTVSNTELSDVLPSTSSGEKTQ